MRLGDRKSFGKVAKQGVAWSFLREGVTEVVLFPASMVVARLLSPEEFGIAASGLFFVQMAARMADLGLNAALVRAKEVTEDHLASVFSMTLGLGVFACLVLVAIAPLVRSFYRMSEIGDVLMLASIGFLIVPFGSIPGALLTRDGRFRESAIVDWYSCLAFAVLSVVLAALGFSFWSLTYARLASLVAQAGARLYYYPWRPSFRFSRGAAGEVLSFGLGSQAKRLLDYAANNLDNVAVGRLMGMNALGLYDKAFSTMNRLLVRMNTGGPTMMFRVFSLIHEDPARFGRAYSRVLMSATLMGFPILAGLVVAAPQVMTVLFGANWLPAAEPFRILGITGMVKLVNSYASAAIQGAGWAWSEVWRQIVYILLIVSGVYLLRDYGTFGAAGAVLAASVVMFFLMHGLLTRIARLTWGQMLRPQVPAVLCAAGVAATAWLVERGLSSILANPPALLVLACQSVAAVVFGALFVFFAPLRDMRELVCELIADLAPAWLRNHRLTQRYVAEFATADR